ncbi:MAG: hypothetical protein WC538_20625 [Thermoanaerobaculia bacterium]|jgi:hypothetical protein
MPVRASSFSGTSPALVSIVLVSVPVGCIDGLTAATLRNDAPDRQRPL